MKSEMICDLTSMAYRDDTMQTRWKPSLILSS